MQTEWIWAAKANQAILTEKRSQKVWLKQELINKKRVYAVFQRSRDIFFSLLAIIVLSPLMLLTALLIVLDDPHGGPIFSQYRIGKNGRKFKLYKFRSMVVHAEDNLESLMQQNEMDGPVFKIKKDPRITRIGHFIRLLVTPGLTCYWQIQPQRNSLSFEEWVALDIQYIQDRSYWLDWKIIFKTVGAVLTCQGE